MLLKPNAEIGSPKYRIRLASVPERLPDTTGAPEVFDWTIPYGLLPSFLYCFLMLN